MELDISPNANIVILTGAGISKASGLSTFRDKDGIWSQVRIEDVATPEAFQRNPIMVQDFYNMRRRMHSEKALVPNQAHEALALLEDKWGGDVLVVTQNVDDLHEKAGSSNLIHMHGEMKRVRCLICDQDTVWLDDLDDRSECPFCRNIGTLRPHVVWFGEQPMQLERIYQALAQCDLFISIGTSGNVYPAAGFVQEVKTSTDAVAVELNLEKSLGNNYFDHTYLGEAIDVVPEFVESLLGKYNLA